MGRGVRRLGGRGVLAGAALGLLAGLPAAATTEHQYCIVGAGPAGVQLGHFLHHAKRDYVIFEINQRAGSFFERYPRHRKLISLNKRFVREGRSAEFALRHDWNSLLDVREEGNRTRPMTQRSKELFPHADVLANYISEFAEEQRGAIRYGTEVSNLRRSESGTGFLLDLRPVTAAPDTGDVETARCREVIVATGFWRPRGVKAKIDGAEYVEGYEDMPETGEAFEGKSVMVLGLGNAAMETVQELQKYTAEVHLFSRPRELPEGGTGVRFAHMTHYVGDIRAGRTTILDTYLLKSLDSLDFDALEGPTRMAVLPCSRGMRRCIWTVRKDDCLNKRCEREFDRGGQNLDYWLPIAVWASHGTVGTRIRETFARLAPQEAARSSWKIEDTTLDDEETHPELAIGGTELRRELGIHDEVFAGNYSELIVKASLLRSNPSLLDELMPFRARNTGDNLRYPMDHVIRCFGWAMDQSIFKGLPVVNTTHNGKYPQILPTYESADVPGLYFAGTLTHGRDFRRSAGGFIHGFRYTARALFRLLEQRNFGVPWPARVLPLRTGAGTWSADTGVKALVDLLMGRINEASGPYQMFGTLGDVVLLEGEATAGNWSARYLEEMPLEHAHEEFRHLPRLVWVFRYGKGFHGPKVLGENRVGSTSAATAHLSNFLHPEISFFPAGEVNASARHYLTEDIFTAWDSEEMYTPLARFVARAVVAATGDPLFTERGVFARDPADGEACRAAPAGAHGRDPAAVAA